MNERIKELAKEAALVYKIIPSPATHTTPLYLIDNFKKNERPAGIEIISDGFCEKFAELIVFECLGICEELGDKGMDGHYCADKILKHFGVYQ